MRMILGAGDDAWCAVSRQAHRLRLVKLGILECREPHQTVSQGGMQAFLGDIEFVSEHQLQSLGQLTRNRRLFALSRRRSRPRLGVILLLWRQAYAQNSTPPLGLLYRFLDLLARELAHGREIGPLVRPGREILVEENAVRMGSRPQAT